MDRTDTPGSRPGKFWLVSTGPGDSKYLTLQAIEAIEKADLVLTRPEEARKVQEYLRGKRVEGPEKWDELWAHEGRPWVSELPSFTPEERAAILKSKCRQKDEYVEELKEWLRLGKNVVILDGGDPTVFSRFFFWLIEGFSEEEVEVVPGIGAMNAAFAALKRCSTGARARYVVQTDLRSFFRDGEPDGLARDLSGYPGTLVFYMALEELERLVEGLGRFHPGDLPVAVVYHAGCSGREKIVRGTLDSIVKLVADEEEKWMGLVVVGRCLTDSDMPSQDEDTPCCHRG